MPQICSVCRHDKRQEIDQALLDQQPLRTIAARWSVSKTALIRHRQDHLPAKLAKAPAAIIELARSKADADAARLAKAQAPAVELVKAKAAAEEAEAETLFERLRSINRETLTILQDAKASKNSVIALQAIGRIEKQLELEARLLGELDESTKIAVGVQVNAAPSQNLDLAKLSSEELQQLRALIIKAQPVTLTAQFTEEKGQ